MSHTILKLSDLDLDLQGQTGEVDLDLQDKIGLES